MIYIDHLDEELEIEYEITYLDRGRPAQLWGENPYPEEYPELEFEIIKINGKNAKESDLDFNEIEEKYYDELEGQIWEKLYENEG